jgi:PAS domain S-box-containing protein
VTETPRLPDDELVFRRIVEDSPTAVMLLTSESNPRVLYASPRMEEISGFAPGQLLEHPELWFRRIHPDGRAAIGGKWASSVVSRTRFEADYRFQHRNGEWRWFRETSTPMLGSDGSVQYRQSFIEDISPERFAYTQAERSEARYRSLVERLPVVVYVDSDEQRPRSLYVSPNSLEMLGYAPGDYLADSDLWFSSMHPDDLERVRETWADSIQTKSPFH